MLYRIKKPQLKYLVYIGNNHIYYTIQYTQVNNSLKLRNWEKLSKVRRG